MISSLSPLLRRCIAGVLGCVSLVGCGPGSNATDPCATGACDAIPDCELGVCDGDELVFAGHTVPDHDMNEATSREQLSAACPFSANEIPPIEVVLDDSNIPEYRRARGRRANHREGDAFLQDHELHEHLMGVQGSLFECLDVAACYHVDSSGTGALDFQFELEPTGKVSAVSVTPSAELDQPVVRACARRSLFETTFPSWNGSRMVVDYSIQIAES